MPRPSAMVSNLFVPSELGEGHFKQKMLMGGWMDAVCVSLASPRVDMSGPNVQQHIGPCSFLQPKGQSFVSSSPKGSG